MPNICTPSKRNLKNLRGTFYWKTLFQRKQTNNAEIFELEPTNYYKMWNKMIAFDCLLCLSDNFLNSKEMNTLKD